eukprot:CAMPEP_0204283072 /NCGR_PEP_ID=MMETSP0468-20130131/45227_1 /ASSEMBLY_ACC=CAM_ASM_000383 /TAXON_ID=2969 /ORGANISM="Oxyrrhis marina" /LENGTH=58 /DNA_ID=CAMNT_0051260649 /DNA_START=52 /DNA_END=225 /DNA_ORIENTATION=-
MGSGPSPSHDMPGGAPQLAVSEPVSMMEPNTTARERATTTETPSTGEDFAKPFRIAHH